MQAVDDREKQADAYHATRECHNEVNDRGGAGMPGLESVERIRARTVERGAAGLLVLNPVNLRYLTGYHSNAYSPPLALVLGRHRAMVLLVPRLHAAPPP